MNSPVQDIAIDTAKSVNPIPIIIVHRPSTKINPPTFIFYPFDTIDMRMKIFYFMVNKFNEQTPKGYFGMGVYLGDSLTPVRELPRGFVPFQIRAVLPSLLEDYSILKFIELQKCQ